METYTLFFKAQYIPIILCKGHNFAPRGRLWRTICISFVLIFLADNSKYVITWLNGFDFWPDWLKMVLCLFKNKIAATCTDCKPILNSLPLRNSFLFSFYFRLLPCFIPDASSILLHLLGKKTKPLFSEAKRK